MGKIGGAVQRIDVPTEVGVGFVASALFGDDAVIGVKFGEAFDDAALGTLVSLGDQIGFAFVGDAGGPIEFFAKDFASFLGDFDGGFAIIFDYRESAPPMAMSWRQTRARLPLYHPHGFGSIVEITARMRG